MRKLLSALAAACVLALGVGATPAAAATEFGSNCIGNRAESGEAQYSVVQQFQNGAPIAAPVSGVVTKWKTQLVAVPFFVPQQLKVFRPTGPASFQVVGESAMANLTSGENVNPTRIPIQAGDHLGLFGPPSINTLFCAETPETENPGNVTGFIIGNPATGSTATLVGAESEVLVPAVAVIEPDADNDGFGDETQDACPQSAAVQSPCPVVQLSVSATAQKKAVTLLVTGPVAGNVTANGVVSLGKGKKAKLKGGTKALTPGAFTKFKLKFTSALTKRLKELPPGKKLTLKVTASAPNVVGAPTKKVIKVKLKGQG